MAEVDLRVVAISLAALAAVWPSRLGARRVVWAASGSLVVSSSWSVTFAERRLGWAVVLVVLVAVMVGWAMPILYGVFTTPMYTWVLFAGCLGAVHVCVPENDHTAEIGLALAGAGVAELLMRRRLPLPVWSAAGAGLLWSAVYGSSGLSRAIIGGLFAVLPIVGVAFFVRPRPSMSTMSEATRWMIVTVWVAGSWVVARTGGIADTGAAAWIAVSVALAVVVPTSWLLCRRRPVRVPS